MQGQSGPSKRTCGSIQSWIDPHVQARSLDQEAAVVIALEAVIVVTLETVIVVALETVVVLTHEASFHW